jgi:uncharacterized protein (DUF952 family)
VSNEVIYKIATGAQWRDAQASGVFRGAPVDLADGYIHFSTAAQVAETLAKHFAMQHDLLLIAVATEPLGPALRWEPSRGGQLFPHLYASLPIGAALRVDAISVADNGVHILDGLIDRGG